MKKNDEDLKNKIIMQEKAIKLLNCKIEYQKGTIRELKNKLLETRRILRKYKKKVLVGEKNERK